MTQSGHSTSRTPLRLWPGVAAAVLLVLIRLVLPVVVPEVGFVSMIGGLAATLAILVWWLLFSRAPWSERVGALVLMIIALVATSRLVHVSIATGGMGVLFFIYAIPVLSLALVAWAVATRRLSDGPRRVSLVATILLACGMWTLLRTDGITSDVIGSDFRWRWTPTAEARLLAEEVPLGDPAPSEPAATEPAAREPVPAEPVRSEPAVTPVAAPEVMRAEWPGFRGPRRDGVVRGVRIDTDWSLAPPVEIWRRAIGPGWSSLAVQGELVYTQEQRGDDELVSCYRLATGEPVWQHRDAVRFWESNGGAGPRATPTVHADRVYAFGATGILNALDASTGVRVWSADVAADTGRSVPIWGFASSPLVVDDVVIVAAAGTLVAYDRATGSRRWTGPSYGGSYSSPHQVTFGGVVQVVLLGGPGVISVAPADGTVLWEHAWSPGPIVQPALTADGDLLINAIATTGGLGTRRLRVTPGPGPDSGRDGWTVEELWTSNGLKPYFNDFVVHGGHAFGFDGNILASINLEDGRRNWKGGRFGNGQLLLLPDQDVMLVLSDEGVLALVSATPDQFTEIARFPAIEGKTWNHPVLVGDVLLVRNGQEMAAFRLTLAAR